KLGGATLRWHDARREQRTERRNLFERAVGMPEHVGELVDHPTIVGRNDLARRDVEVRLAREGRARRRVDAARDLEVSEAPAEGDLLLVVQRLAPEEQHGMLLEGGADLRPCRI